MNKQSFSVWIVLVCVVISFTFFVGGNDTSAKITNGYLQSPTLGDDSTADENSEQNSDSSSAAFGLLDYIKVLLSLGFVLGLLIFVLRFLNKKNITYQQNNMLQSLGGVSVGPQKSVQIVKVGSRILVVGVGEDIQLLVDIDDEAEVERLIELYDDQFNQPANKPYIMQLFAKKKAHDTASATTENKQFSTLLNQRLSEIKKERSDELERWKDKENDKR